MAGPITNNPQVWGAATRESVVYESQLLQSGIVKQSNAIAVGQTEVISQYVEPFSDLAGLTRIATATTAVTAGTLGASKSYDPIVYYGEGVKQSRFEQVTQGIDTLAGVVAPIGEKVSNDISTFYGSILTGVYATALAATHVNTEISGTGLFSDEGFRKTKSLLGSKTRESLKTALMHGKIYDDLVSNGLAQWVSSSEWSGGVINTGDIPVLDGTRLIKDDATCAAVGDFYPTYISDFGTLASSPQTGLYFTFKDDPDVGGGTQSIFWYYTYALSMLGMSWDFTITNPTAAQLATGANWTQKWNDKNIKMVKYITKAS